MPQIVVLDTHIWYWWINQEYHRFPKQWNDIIEAADKVAVSPVSCFEIALLHQRQKLSLPCDSRQ
jgi:PIN domain nuclease of toxin-antitoxin system